jgi:long-chain acyl-CoA synthetase
MQDFTRLFDVLHSQKTNCPQAKTLSFKYGGNEWISLSIDQTIEAVDNYSLAFLANGLQKGDKVAIISANRPEWNLCDNGLMQAGGINVPIYPTSSEKDYEFICNDAEIQYLFIGDGTIYDRVKELKSKCPSIKEIYSFEKVENCKHVSEFLALSNEDLRPTLKTIMDSIDPMELATIIYTSGTTGTPKGVMLSHNNIVSNIKAVAISLPLIQGQIALSFLPLCHIFERVVTYYYFAIGVNVYYADSLEKISENLKEVKPHFFTTVPRLLEKVYDKLIAKGNELTGFKKSLYFWAIKLANNYKENQGWDIRYAIADKLIYSKWREALGGNIVGIVTGAAALQERLARVFNAAGISVREGYGQTETSPVISFNRFEKGGFKFGSVGLLIPDVELRFGDNGEIQVKGPNVMMGYYKNDKATNETIMDGWLHTGDVGVLEEGKYLKITDRIKELFKTSGGKYVAPQVIENKLKESRFIEQVIVVGENEKFISALIIPSFVNLKEWAMSNHINEPNDVALLDNPSVQALYKSEIERLNKGFGQVEQVKKFKLIAKEWTIDSGELTPTLKVKRKIIMEKCKSDVDFFYK